MNAIWIDLFRSPVETWEQDEVPKLLSAAEIRNIPEVGKNAKTFRRLSHICRELETGKGRRSRVDTTPQPCLALRY